MSWLKQRPPLLALALAVLPLAAFATVGAGGTAISSDSRTPTPRVRQLDPGDLRAQVVARESPREVSVQARPPYHGNPELERAAFRVLGSERRSGGLAQALGAVPLTAVQVGDLNARGRRLGATMLVALVEPRRDLRATVPAYVPVEDDSGAPYTPQRVRMHVAVLRDALIDIDLGRQRVISFEPGPRSESLSWSPSEAPAPAGAGDEN